MISYEEMRQIVINDNPNEKSEYIEPKYVNQLMSYFNATGYDKSDEIVVKSYFLYDMLKFTGENH